MRQFKTCIILLVPTALCLIIFTIVSTEDAFSHHYKGLPHYGYFDNYPQVPYLEFIKETPDYEVFVTVYNFQGLNLEQVESSDDVRLYLYIYDLAADKIYKNEASFEVFSHGELVYRTGKMVPEQESIFVIQKSIEKQDDLLLRVKLHKENDSPVVIEVPFQITKSFFQKYALYIFIALFFGLVIGLKTFTSKRNANSDKDSET